MSSPLSKLADISAYFYFFFAQSFIAGTFLQDLRIILFYKMVGGDFASQGYLFENSPVPVYFFFYASAFDLLDCVL